MKKLLCGILAVMLIFSAFVACGETENPITTTTTTTTTTKKTSVLKAWSGEFSEKELRSTINEYQRDYTNIVLKEDSAPSVSFEADFEVSSCSGIRLSRTDDTDIEVELNSAINLYIEASCDGRTVTIPIDWWYAQNDSWIKNYFVWSYLVCVKDANGSSHYYYFRVDYTAYKGNKDLTDLYTLTKNDDNTYSYSFSDLEGKILFEKDDVIREPKINQIADNVYELITQTGTGLSTNWAVYCDVKNSQTSDIYYYVLAAKENYVICGGHKNGEHFIVVQEIFDTNGDRYYKEYKLEDASPVAADFTVDCKIDANGNAVVTYITGDDYTETDLTISLP